MISIYINYITTNSVTKGSSNQNALKNVTLTKHKKMRNLENSLGVQYVPWREWNGMKGMEKEKEKEKRV